MALEVIRQVTTSPSTGEYEKNEEFDPEFAPFTFHWYAGEEPPLVGVAVKSAFIPWQTLVEAVAINTPTTWFVLTVMVTAFDNALFPDAHVAFEVS